MNFEGESKLDENNHSKHRFYEHNFINHNKTDFKHRLEFSVPPFSFLNNEFFSTSGSSKRQSICSDHILQSTGIKLKNREYIESINKNTGIVLLLSIVSLSLSYGTAFSDFIKSLIVCIYSIFIFVWLALA